MHDKSKNLDNQDIQKTNVCTNRQLAQRGKHTTERVVRRFTVCCQPLCGSRSHSPQHQEAPRESLHATPCPNQIQG
jgi:hypothetical protein